MIMNDNLGNFQRRPAESFEVFAGPPPADEEVADAVAEADYWSTVADQLAAIADDIDKHPPLNLKTLGWSLHLLTENLNRAIGCADHYAAASGRRAQTLAERRGDDA